MVQGDPTVVDAEPVGEGPLEADGDVAQSDGPVARVEQGAGDDADGVGEVHDPRVGGARGDPLGQVQHDRNRAQGLGQAAGAGGLLADAAALVRQRLVQVAGLLAADPQLDQHRVGAVHPGVGVGGGADPGRMALLGQDAPGQRGDHREPVGVGVHQGDLLHWEPEPGEAVHQLRRIGGTAADDGDLHPLTPVLSRKILTTY